MHVLHPHTLESSGKNTTVLFKDFIFFFFEQFWVHSKFQNEVLWFLTCPLPSDVASLLPDQHPWHGGTLVITEEAPLSHHQVKPIVRIIVRSVDLDTWTTRVVTAEPHSKVSVT